MLCAKSGHWPGLQRDVAVEHPAVLQLHWLGCGGPFARGGRRGEDGVAAAAQCVAVERVGRGLVVGQRLVVVRWRDGRPQGGLAVKVWSSWGKKLLKKTFIRLSINYQLAMSKTVLSDAGNVNAITAQWGRSAIRINIKSGTKGCSRWWQPAKAVCVVILSFRIHMQTFRGGREPLKHATTQLVKTLVRQETPVFSFWAVPALLGAVFSYLMKQH